MPAQCPAQPPELGWPCHSPVLLDVVYFYMAKYIYHMKFATFTILSVQSSNIDCIHSVVHHHYLFPKRFHHPKRTLCLLTTNSPWPLPPAPGIHHSTFCLYEFDSYIWNHTIFVLLCLTYLTQHNAFKIHPCGSTHQNFIIFMANIPLYVCSTFCLPSVDTDCSHFIIMNNAAANIGVHASVSLPAFHSFGYTS